MSDTQAPDAAAPTPQPSATPAAEAPTSAPEGESPPSLSTLHERLKASMAQQDETPAQPPTPTAEVAAEAPQPQMPEAVATALATIMEDRRKLEQEQASWKEERTLAEQIREAKELAKRDPKAAAKRNAELLGLDPRVLYDALTAEILGTDLSESTQQTAETAQMRRELEELKQAREQDERRKSEEAERAKQEESRSEALKLVGAELDKEDVAQKYPYLTTYKATAKPGESPAELVWGVIESEWQRTGQEMSFDKAAEAVEDHLKSFANRFGSLLAPEQANGAKQDPPSVPGSPTIAQTTAPTQAQPEPDHVPDRDESLNRAWQKLRAQLAE